MTVWVSVGATVAECLALLSFEVRPGDTCLLSFTFVHRDLKGPAGLSSQSCLGVENFQPPSTLLSISE